MYRISFISTGIGEIQIDEYVESFQSDLSYWKQDQYEQHWLEAREALTAGNEVCFLTSISDPENANFFRAWSGYPDGGEVIFQEQILFLDSMIRPFNANSPHFNSLPYTSETEDGLNISEWRTFI